MSDSSRYDIEEWIGDWARGTAGGPSSQDGHLATAASKVAMPSYHGMRRTPCPLSDNIVGLRTSPVTAADPGGRADQRDNARCQA